MRSVLYLKRQQKTKAPTRVESLEFFACRFGIVHPLQHRSDTRIILAPEVVRDCDARLAKVGNANIFDCGDAHRNEPRRVPL